MTRTQIEQDIINIRERIERTDIQAGHAPTMLHDVSRMQDYWRLAQLQGLLDPSCRYPEQYLEFLEVCSQMYIMHVSKSSDYGSHGIARHGIDGVIVRMSDKLERLITLSNKTYHKETKNEPIEDTLMDLASYAVIGLILYRKKWGK